MAKTSEQRAATISAKVLNDAYPAAFDVAFEAEFGENVTTSFSLFVGIAGELITRRASGHPLSKKHIAWSKAFSSGYFAAVVHLRRSSNG